MEELTMESLIDFLNKQIDDYDDLASTSFDLGNFSNARVFESKSEQLEVLISDIKQKFK